LGPLPVVPDGPDVVVRAPGRFGRGQGTCPVLPGPFPRSVEKPRFGRGLKGFSPAVRTVIVEVVPDGPDGVLRAPGRPGDASGILVGLFWPHRGRLKNRPLDMGLRGFRPPARTVTVGVVPDGPDGVLRASGRPGGASGILAGLLWPHRRSVEKPTSGHGAKGL